MDQIPEQITDQIAEKKNKVLKEKKSNKNIMEPMARLPMAILNVPLNVLLLSNFHRRVS